MDEKKAQVKPDMAAIHQFLEDLNAERLSIEEHQKRIRAEQAKRLDAATRQMLRIVYGKVG